MRSTAAHGEARAGILWPTKTHGKPGSATTRRPPAAVEVPRVIKLYEWVSSHSTLLSKSSSSSRLLRVHTNPCPHTMLIPSLKASGYPAKYHISLQVTPTAAHLVPTVKHQSCISLPPLLRRLLSPLLLLLQLHRQPPTQLMSMLLKRLLRARALPPRSRARLSIDMSPSGLRTKITTSF